MNIKHASAAAAAALAVAAAVAGGCAGNVITGHPVAAPATATAAPRPVAPAQQVPLPTHTWHDVQGEVTVSTPQQGTEMASGNAVAHTKDEGYSKCTIGPAVVTGEGTGIVTAGHCMNRATGDRSQFLYAPDHVQVIGTLNRVVGGGWGTDGGLVLTPVTSAATMIAGRWPVAGVMTVKEAQTVLRASRDANAPIICMDGAMSGIRCGVGTELDNGSGAVSRDGVPISQGGDSGSSVFAVDVTGRAALIGTLIGVPEGDDHTVFSYLDPALDALGAKALLAPGVTPFNGPNFSTRVSSYS